MIDLKQPDRLRQFAVTVIACLMVLALSLSATPSHAQQSDTSAPVIDINELADGVADHTQVFTVRVESKSKLEEVLLFHRRMGEINYTPSSMQILDNTDYYTVAIKMDINDLRPIEYYVLARDDNNNRTISGFAFDPYRRILQAAPNPILTPINPVLTSNTPAPTAPASTPTPSTPTASANELPPILQQRWVQITLGVLAVGALASLASSSGSSSGAETRIVPLTFNLQ